jgi:hypothetical protein
VVHALRAQAGHLLSPQQGRRHVGGQRMAV